MYLSVYLYIFKYLIDVEHNLLTELYFFVGT